MKQHALCPLCDRSVELVAPEPGAPGVFAYHDADPIRRAICRASRRTREEAERLREAKISGE